MYICIYIYAIKAPSLSLLLYPDRIDRQHYFQLPGHPSLHAAFPLGIPEIQYTGSPYLAPTVSMVGLSERFSGTVLIVLITLVNASKFQLPGFGERYVPDST